MRKVSGASIAMVMAIALYFTLFWGYEAVRVLTSPTYGLDDVWGSQYIFGVGSYFKLSPIGLMKLAAFFGALKLAVAMFGALGIVLRLLTAGGARVARPVLEGALILAASIGLITAGAAVSPFNADLLLEQLPQIALALIALAQIRIEHRYGGAVDRPRLSAGMALTAPPA